MVKVFCDSADWVQMAKLAGGGIVKGFTTNPTLMRKAGIEDYVNWGKTIAGMWREFPISFEVVADDLEEMYRQAKIINAWGKNAYVKIPITNSKGEYTTSLIDLLSREDYKVNVTAVFTHEQIDELALISPPAVVSIFAGRIMDAGRNAVDTVRYAEKKLAVETEILWASPRQVYDFILAEQAGADIITMTPELIAKLPGLGRDLSEFSLETVRMFLRDATESGYAL